MVRFISVKDMRELIKEEGLEDFFRQVLNFLEDDFVKWKIFRPKARIAEGLGEGTIELMPISDLRYYTFKYVTGYPKNLRWGKQTVTAFGVLADIFSGYPLLLSEMTLLTAIRTAVVAAISAKYLACRSSRSFGIIGTGAQSEFQVLAHYFFCGITDVYYYDKDERAMEKFARNLSAFDLRLHPLSSAEAVCKNSEIITTTTAVYAQQSVIKKEWIKEGTHINAVGGDAPNKTELDPALLESSKVVVEYLPQSQVEGEIQRADSSVVYAELWEIISYEKAGRTSREEVTLFDSVGFAIEDFSVLRLVHQLAEKRGLGQKLDLIANPCDPKDLFSLLI